MGIAFRANKEPEKWAKTVKEAGQKILVIYQPITGNTVSKKFYTSAINVMSPAALMALVEKYGIQTKLHVDSNFPIDFNRNNAVDTALECYLADYMFFMDTDQTFPGDTLKNLFELVSDETPVVAGMYYKKAEPYTPVIGRYAEWTKEYKDVKHHLKQQGFVDRRGNQTLYWQTVHYFDRDKPFYADVIGAGCMLIKTSVFKRLKRPYFKYAYDPLLKDPALNKVSEDMYFCAMLKDAQIPILIDPRVQCGHLTELESNIDIFESMRDQTFEASMKNDPEKHINDILPKVIDVRGEQKQWAR